MKAQINKKSIKREDELFKLIKSLTKSEKRHFKIFSERHVIRGQNNYVQLFDFLDRQKVYNDKEIKTHFSGKKFILHLEVTKNYLHKMIMQSLRAYYDKVHPTDEVVLIIKDIKILLEKGLLKRASKVLLKAKEKAEQYDMYPKLIEIIDLEYFINSRQSSLTQTDRLQEVMLTDKEKVIEILNNVNEYSKLHFRFSRVVRHAQVLRDKKQMKLLSKIMSHPLLVDEKNALSFQSRYRFLDTWGIYYSMTGDHLNSFRFGKKMINLIESYPHLINAQPGTYIGALNNSTIFCLRLKRFDEAEQLLEKMKKFKHPYGRVQAQMFEVLCDLELSYYLMTGQFNKGVNLISYIEKEREKHKEHLKEDAKVSLIINYCSIYLGAGNYKKALHWINIMLNQPGTNLRDDAHCSIRIMNLIVHYELGNKLVLPYILRSTYRFFYKRNAKYEVETIFFKNIRKLVSANTNKELDEVYKKIHSQLTPVSEKQFEKGAFEIFDFVSWFESKIENRPFAEIVREKAKAVAGS